jgi:hypothetical protein
MNKSNYNDSIGMCPPPSGVLECLSLDEVFLCPLDEAYLIDVSQVLSLDRILYIRVQRI